MRLDPAATMAGATGDESLPVPGVPVADQGVWPDPVSVSDELGGVRR